MKLENDKYYTPLELARRCIEKTYEIIGKENITEIIEPSAGNGSFSSQLECVAYDISPDHPSINQADYLVLDIPHKQGRLVIGNPPYGSKMRLAQMFFKKSVQIADFVAFILPISQLNNTRSMYEFDLVYSEDLGVERYTDRNLKCCFNIYKRPLSGINRKPIDKLNDISIYRQDSTGYEQRDFDLRMCYWGDGSAGKILSDGDRYSAEYKIKINNNHLKEQIIQTLTNFDWKSYLNCIAMRKIQQFHIIDVLKKSIDRIS